LPQAEAGASGPWPTGEARNVPARPAVHATKTDARGGDRGMAMKKKAAKKKGTKKKAGKKKK
jgi:hypothetical protein